MGDFFISVADLKALLDSGEPPLLCDVRKPQAYKESGKTMPGAVWRDHTRLGAWANDIPPRQPVVVYCVHGHEVSQGAGTTLRERGIDARVLGGGFEAWRGAGGAIVLAPNETDND